MDKQTLGKWGEDFTCRYLQQNGYEIIARNVHSRYGEIDMIAVDGPYIVFIEVKTRAQDAGTGPLEAVTPAKQRRIIQTALCYLQEHPSRLQPRFDVAAVVVGEEGLAIEYLKDAFDGGGYELF